MRGHGIRGVDPREQLPFAACAGLQIFVIAVVGEAHRKPHLELRVGEKTRKPIVGLHERARPGRDVDAVDFEESLVALVMRDQQFVGEMMRGLVDVASHARRRRERQDVAGLDIDPMGLPILVAALLAKEHDMAVVVEPLHPRPQAAVGHPRQGPRVANIVERGHPEIQHAVQRSEVSDTTPVRADVHD